LEKRFVAAFLVMLFAVSIITPFYTVSTNAEAATSYEGEFQTKALWMTVTVRYRVSDVVREPETRSYTMLTTLTVYGLMPIKIVSAHAETKDSMGKIIVKADPVKQIGEIWIRHGEPVSGTIRVQRLIDWDEFNAYPSNERFTTHATVQCLVWGWLPYTYQRTDSVTKTQLVG